MLRRSPHIGRVGDAGVGDGVVRFDDVDGTGFPLSLLSMERFLGDALRMQAYPWGAAVAGPRGCGVEIVAVGRVFRVECRYASRVFTSSAVTPPRAGHCPGRPVTKGGP